ncbi:MULTISPECIES: glycine cleavage system protein GcvH [Sphingomonadaceae]|uniref:glycine cleavage system protein GcvH n=1 Tax=Sphingomonadaceae TaxID=41297 RepID=UPI00115899D8|nr:MULTISPECIES: glycine cleavage system protein GcvH [Sphingomonadaceae]QDK32344.1 glycine cleavage system protein GcvH [Sphingomonas sp. IC081]QSR18747.1 glycine cleavage system protein H [Novosphingobium sp. KA1]
MTRYFSQEHEWIEIEGDLGTVGITDYAQGQLGDITFVDLPAEGATFEKGDSVAVVDSVKAASDVYTPVSGTIAEANEVLADQPELVNTDAEVGGWLFRITLSDASELEALMDEAAYKDYVESL